jgi:hypothetical protein
MGLNAIGAYGFLAKAQIENRGEGETATTQPHCAGINCTQSAMGRLGIGKRAEFLEPL